MTSMNISLPEPMRDYIEEQVSMGGYGTASEYLRELIRTDQKQKQVELEAALLHGLESPMRKWTPEDIDFIKNAVRERLAQKRESE